MVPVGTASNVGPCPGTAVEQTAHSRARLGPAEVLVLAVWFGILTGLAEVAIAVFQVLCANSIVPEFPEMLWMTPLSDVLLLAIPGVIFAVGSKLWPRIGSLRLVTFVYTSVALICVLERVPTGMRNYARALLAVGLSTQASWLIARHPLILSRLLTWTTAWARPWNAWSAPRAASAGIGDGIQGTVDRRQVLASP